MRQLVVLPNDGTEFEWENDHVFVKTPQEMTDGRVTVVADTLKSGFLLPRHHHRAMVEIFLILDGEVVFAFDDETVTLAAGTTLTIPSKTVARGLVGTLVAATATDVTSIYVLYAADLSGVRRCLDAAMPDARPRQHEPAGDGEQNSRKARDHVDRGAGVAVGAAGGLP